MRIEVKNLELKNKSGQSKRTGKDYSFFEQKAYAHLPDKPYPVEMTLTVDSGQPPYALGFYTLGDKSYYVDKYGQLVIKPVLVKA